MDDATAAELFESIVAMNETFGEVSGTGSLERRDGYLVHRSLLDLPDENGMLVFGPQEEPAIAAMPELRERFAAEGRTFGVVTIDDRTPAVVRAAEDLGLRFAFDSTTMRLEPSDLRPLDLEGLDVRRLPATEAETWVRLMAAGFEETEELFRTVLTPALLARLDEDWLGVEVAWVDGEPVSTATYVVGGKGAMIGNVATPPEHRGKGYAGAVTTAAIRAGLAAGASFGVLHASPMGLGLYRRLGFVEAWTSQCRAVPDEEG